MSYIADNLARKLDERISRLEDSMLAVKVIRACQEFPAPGEVDEMPDGHGDPRRALTAAREELHRLRIGLGDTQLRHNVAEKRNAELGKQVATERERADQWHATWMAQDRIMSAITDSMTDATQKLQRIFGTDLTWDELIAAAVEELENRAEDA